MTSDRCGDWWCERRESWALLTARRQHEYDGAHMPAAMLARGISVLALIATCAVAAEAQTNLESRAPSADRGVDKPGVFFDSLALLGIEHGIRLALQPGTRRELSGNFWDDYRGSLHLPKHWEDTDSWPVNYIGHPIHGAAAGYLWLEHDPKAPITIE